MKNEYQNRIIALQKLLKKKDIDALLITDPFNIRYLANFTGTNGQIIVAPKACFFLTDFRYIAVAKKALPNNIKLLEIKNNFQKTLHRLLLQKKRIKKVAHEDTLLLGLRPIVCFEEKHLTVLQYRNLKKTFPKIKFKPTQHITESLREIKSKQEIQYIVKAQRIAEKVFLEVKNRLKAGKTEIDIAKEIEQLAHKFGANSLSFPSIVGFGKNSASPHHQNTKKRLKQGDIILIDMGVIYKGYCSDMTRMIFTKNPSPLEQKIYTIVLEAQMESIKKLKAGVISNKIDQTARDIINKAGYGKNFGHSLGHGIGLEVHEGPYLSAKYNKPLPDNAIVTVEPGIYLENIFGVRIEDMVLIHSNGVKNLTKIPKEIGNCIIKL